MNAVLLFGSGALILFSLVYFFFDFTQRKQKERSFSITFARLFGLLTVGVLGAGLALVSSSNQLASSGFTLLGTIAGYLAGAKPTAVEPAEDDESEGTGTERPRARRWTI